MTRIESIPLKKVKPNRLNPRTEFRKEALDQLADSISLFGLLQPVVVRPSDGSFEVVVGERRYRAAQQAGLDEIPAVIRDYSDEEVLELNLIENLHREDLTAIERGKTCTALLKGYPSKYPSVPALAKRLGYSEGIVRDWIELVEETPTELQRLIAPEREDRRIPEGRIDYRTAVRIAKRIKEPEKKVEVAQALVDKGIRGLRAREVVDRIAKQPAKSVNRIIEEAEQEPGYLPFSYKHAQDIIGGKKNQTTRKSLDPKIQEGAVVRAAITHFADLKVTGIERKRLSEFNEEDAKREGGYSLKEFREVWKSLHGEWDPDESVYVVHFRLARVM